MARVITPAEKTLNVAETRQRFAELIDEVSRGESHVVVEKSGTPVAAIISPRELEEFRILKERDVERIERLEKELVAFSAAFRDVPDEEFERELEEARREYREWTDREHGRS